MAGKRNAKVKMSRNNLTGNVETKRVQTTAQTQENTMNRASGKCEETCFYICNNLVRGPLPHPTNDVLNLELLPSSVWVNSSESTWWSWILPRIWLITRTTSGLKNTGLLPLKLFLLVRHTGGGGSLPVIRSRQETETFNMLEISVFCFHITLMRIRIRLLPWCVSGCRLRSGFSPWWGSRSGSRS